MDILSLLWLGIIGFSLLMYVVLDGFTLGVGILIPMFNRHERDLAISTLLPTWDGNQTWLVFALASFYGMFPIAFAYVFPELYLLAILLAVMLLFRGICFEFRLKSKKGIDNWDKLFALSSLIATFIQGYIVGELIIGFPDTNSISEVLFQSLAGVTLVIGYTLLGACRLILKSENELLEKVKAYSIKLAITLLVLMALIGVSTLYHNDLPWGDCVKMSILGVVGVLTIYSFYKLIDYVKKDSAAKPYWSCVAIFVLTYISLLVSIFPYIIPYKITYIEAAASHTTLMFTLIPAVIMIPLLLLYTGYAYYVFRGKTKEKIEY